MQDREELFTAHCVDTPMLYSSLSCSWFIRTRPFHQEMRIQRSNHVWRLIREVCPLERHFSQFSPFPFSISQPCTRLHACFNATLSASFIQLSNQALG